MWLGNEFQEHYNGRHAKQMATNGSVWADRHFNSWKAAYDLDPTPGRKYYLEQAREEARKSQEKADAFDPNPDRVPDPRFQPAQAFWEKKFQGDMH